MARAAGDARAETAASREQADLLAALEPLPEAHREIITLAFFNQLSHSAITERLGLPAEPVLGRRRLGRVKHP